MAKGTVTSGDADDCGPVGSTDTVVEPGDPAWTTSDGPSNAATGDEVQTTIAAPASGDDTWDQIANLNAFAPVARASRLSRGDRR